MKKSLLWGAVGALVLTGGYYASAASSPWTYTDYGYVNPVTVKTTSYAPGTPSEYEYPNSPYQVGGKLGPAPGQTWQQKYDAGTASPTSSHSSNVGTVPTQSNSPAASNASGSVSMTTVLLGGYQISVPVPTGDAVNVSQHNQAHVDDIAVWYNPALVNSGPANVTIQLTLGGVSSVFPALVDSSLTAALQHGWIYTPQSGSATSPRFNSNGNTEQIRVQELGPMGGYKSVTMAVTVIETPGEHGLIHAVVHDMTWKDIWPQ